MMHLPRLVLRQRPLGLLQVVVVAVQCLLLWMLKWSIEKKTTKRTSRPISMKSNGGVKKPKHDFEPSNIKMMTSHKMLRVKLLLRSSLHRHQQLALLQMISRSSRRLQFKQKKLLGSKQIVNVLKKRKSRKS
mmetsp:Transcript_90653/g.261249  ORF Transcript_90653/g.261249 Transcript_90653/m.261249 type:complete len:132 (+) Transcript_90653:375-770(+)